MFTELVASPASLRFLSLNCRKKETSCQTAERSNQTPQTNIFHTAIWQHEITNPKTLLQQHSATQKGLRSFAF